MIVDRWEECRVERPKFKRQFSLMELLMFMTLVAIVVFLATR